jgi:hypothetical protein
VGNLTAGHVLVSNFNNSSNQQGTGSTIVDVAPNGSVTLFAHITAGALPGECPGGVGLTTALVVLRSGWVIVGSVPTSNGSANTLGAGCLIVLDSFGNPVETFFGSLVNGPWDMTAFESRNKAKLFFTNVLSGTAAANGQVVDQGTVVRVNLNISASNMPSIESMTVVGSGFPQRADPVALVIGATGVGISQGCSEDEEDDCSMSIWKSNSKPGWKPDSRFDSKFDAENSRALYVADTLNNRVAAIPDALDRTTSAGTGVTISAGGSLNSPLGLVVAPNGHILTVNGGDGFITEITPGGSQIAKTLLDSTGSPAGVGALFGLAFDPNEGVFFVDNNTNTLNLLH